MENTKFNSYYALLNLNYIFQQMIITALNASHL